jgi:1,4-dihydroxy-2-naphthoate octaprenyltransferase
LRDIPLAKPLIIALVVTYLTLSFPTYEQYGIHEIFTASNLTLFIERFVFLVSMTIPFEMRDIQSDRDAGLSTLATYLGFDLAKRITITSLVFWLVLFEVRTILEINYALAIAGFVIFLLGLIGISKLRIDKSELFFVIVFEGLIAFYAASILLFG